MNKKMVLFLSVSQNRGESVYSSDTVGEVTGIYTNDAPTKYFLKKYNGLSEIICITSEKAKESFSNYKNMVFSYCSELKIPNPKINEIDFREGNLSESLNDVIKNINKEDIVYIDTTGGFRNINYMIMMLIRFLEYTGIKCEEVIYSNHDIKKIENVTDLYNTINLINSVQIFTSFGNSSALNKYFSKSENEKIKNLIDVMDKFSEMITLCKSDEIEKVMLELNENINGINEDASYSNESELLFYNIMDTIKEKFQLDKNLKINYTHIIRWCLDNNLIQQAITFYVEKIPSILIERTIVNFSDNIISSYNPDSIYNKNYQLFYEKFMNISNGNLESTYTEMELKMLIEEHQNILLNAKSIDDFKKIVKKVQKPEVYKAIEHIIIMLNARFKGLNIKVESEVDLEIKLGKYTYLLKIIQSIHAKTKEGFLKQITNNGKLLCKLHDENLILSEDEEISTESDSKLTRKIEKVENFIELIENNGNYKLKKISPQNMQKLMRDILYIKNFVRNKVNHASDEDSFTENDKLYFKNYGYEVEDLKIKDIVRVIENSLEILGGNA